jgi:hypothetical protein
LVSSHSSYIDILINHSSNGYAQWPRSCNERFSLLVCTVCVVGVDQSFVLFAVFCRLLFALFLLDIMGPSWSYGSWIYSYPRYHH